MAAPFSNFRMNSPRTRGLHPKSPRFSAPRQGVMPQVQRMPGSGPQQQKLGGYSGFCAVCNLELNSEFQTREHYFGRTHQSNVNMLNLTNDQPKPNSSGYSVFCTICNLNLNSEFQTREHYGGRVHQNNMAMLGIAPDRPESSNSGFIATPVPVKRSASDVGGPSSVKKVKRSPSVSEVKVKNHLELLHEYKPGLEFTITSKPGTNNATTFTATVEIDGKKYNASAPTETLAQSRVASIVFAYVGSHIESVLAQKKAGDKPEQQISHVLNVKDDVLKVKDDVLNVKDDVLNVKDNVLKVENNVPKVEELKKEPEDFTSLDDICSSAAFSCFSTDVTTLPAVVGGPTESDTKAIDSSGDGPPSVNDTTAASDTIDVDGPLVSGATADDSAVPGSSGDAKAGVASQGIKIPRSSTAILNFIWPKISRTLSAQPSSNGIPGDEYVVTHVIDGETFEGKAPTRNCARAYAAEDALVNLFAMKFERDRNGIPMFIGDTSQIVEARESTNASAPANKAPASTTVDKASALELVDGKNPTVLLNELFRRQVTYRFYPQVLSQWGLEHRCGVTCGGMTVEGQHSTKKGAKNRAALAAVAALKASGMYTRLLAETNAQPVDEKDSIVEPQPVVPMNATSRLNSLFPGAKYESQGEVVGTSGRQTLMVAVKIGEKVFTGMGSQPKYARCNAAENALRTLGLWRDEDEEAKMQLRVLAKAKFERKCVKMALMDRRAPSSATGYGWNSQPASNARARARGRVLGGRVGGSMMRGTGHVASGAGRVTSGAGVGRVTRGAGHVTRGAGRATRGAGRGFVAQERRGGAVTQGQQRRARATATRGRGTRGSGSVLAIGGSYYDTSGLTFPAGLGLGGSSNLHGSTNSRVNFIGRKPSGSPGGGTSSINSNLLKMAHGGSSYDMADAGYDMTSDAGYDMANAGYDMTSDVAVTYDTTYDSSAFDQPTDPYTASTTGFYDNHTDPYAANTPELFGNFTTDPYAASTTGFYDNLTDPYAASTAGLYGNLTTDPSCYSVPRSSLGGTRASPRSRLAVKSRGHAASHTTPPSIVHHAVTSMSYTEISGEDGSSSYGVTTQFVRGARASPRRRVLRSRGSAGRGVLQSASATTIKTDFSEGYNYDNSSYDNASYGGYEMVAHEQNYGTSYDDPNAAMQLYYPNDVGLQYPTDMQYDTSSW